MPGEVVINICRPSVLGNPYKVQSPLMLALMDCIAQFRAHLESDLLTGGPMSNEIDRIVKLLLDGQDVILMCWCAPKACHGDVIIEAVNRLVVKRA